MTISGYCSSGIQAVAVGGNLSADQPEGMRREIHQQQEEHLHGSDNRRSIGEQLRIDFVAQAQHQRVG